MRLRLSSEATGGRTGPSGIRFPLLYSQPRISCVRTGSHSGKRQQTEVQRAWGAVSKGLDLYPGLCTSNELFALPDPCLL